MSARDIEIAERITIASVQLRALPWPQFQRRLRQFETALLRSADGVTEKLLVKRQVAKELVIGGLNRKVGPRDFLPAMRRSTALGYSSVDRRVLMACVFAQWAGATSQKRKDALQILNDAKKRALLLRRDSVLRQNLLSALMKAEFLLTA